MNRFTLKYALISLSAVLWIPMAGCRPSPSEDTGRTRTAGVPEGLFLAARPDGALSVTEAKKTAKPGDEVVIEGKIGGRHEPFVDGRAVFLVADASLRSCDQNKGDACRTPWDYCCEPPEELLAKVATVQVTGKDGELLARSLRGAGGLEPLRNVAIAGTVAQAEAGGAFVVRAKGIYVATE